jgi:hypothetical protein
VRSVSESASTVGAAFVTVTMVDAVVGTPSASVAIRLTT